MVTTQKA